MPGVMVHLAVGDALTQILPIKNKSLFLTGNIAPDCIHSRENYSRPMKQHTHLKDGMKDYELLDPERLEVYRERLSAFARKYCLPESESFELYLGYYVHLLTDEIFVRTVRREFAEEAAKDGIAQTDKSFFYAIMRDVNGIDGIMADSYPYNVNIRDFLSEEGIDCDYVTADEVSDSKRWMRESFFGDARFEPPLKITYDRMIDFISSAFPEILDRTRIFFGGMEKDEYYMRAALSLARSAADRGEVPVGAVVVKDGEIVGYGFNRRESDKDPLAHAETEAIKRASEKLGGWRLIGCELYVTLEPCPMCCGAAINSRIERVIYGAADPKAGSVGSVTELFSLPYNHKPTVRPGVLERECSEMLSGFFRRLRDRKKIS